MLLALGIDDHLRTFASEHGAVIWTQVAHAHDWRRTLIDLGTDGETDFLWNLTDVEIIEGLHRATAAVTGVALGGATDWELLQFCQNVLWRQRAKFYIDGFQVEDPFADIGWCDHGNE